MLLSSFIGLLVFSALPVFNIQCDQDQFDYMMDNWDENITIDCEVTVDGVVFDRCTIRIRGDSSRGERKKSYRVEFPSDMPFQGRTSWNFNAEFLDHSYARSWLFSRVLNDMGFPCFTVSHAELYVNGRYLGLFVQLEPVNEAFLERVGLDTEGVLYKAQRDGACTNIYDDVDSLWSLKSGSGTGMNDLVELISLIEYCSPDDFQEFMDSTFAMWGQSGLVRMLALNAAFANNSTYYHNYYLYRDVHGSGKWIMLPWDVDKVLYDNLGISYGGCTNNNWYDNPVHARTLTVPYFREAFMDSVESVFDNWLTDEKLSFWCDSLADQLIDAVSRDKLDGTDPDGFLAALDSLKSNMESRREDLAIQFQIKYYPFRSFRSDTLTTGSLDITWSPTQDPAGNPALYTVWVRDSLGAADTIAVYSGLTDTVFTIPPLPPGFYWWTVETEKQAGWRITEATDRYNPFRVVEPSVLEGTLGQSTVLYSSLSPYYVPEEITVPPGGSLTVQPGVTILFGENGAVNSLGNISFEGAAGDSVFLIAEASSQGWRGIRAENCSVSMDCTVISGARGYDSAPGSDFAALACHRCDVSVQGSVFRNNWSCVKLHRGTVSVNASSFIHNRGELFFMENGEDALITSSEFSWLTDPVASSMDGIEFHLCRDGWFEVKDCVVSHIDGDCIDMNASSVTISETRVSHSTDKGFSIGAPTGGSGSGTTVTVNNTVISNCPIGIAVKDGASFTGDNLLFRSCEKGLYTYEKTSGMGGGFAWTDNSVFEGCVQDILQSEGVLSVTWSISDSGQIPGQGNTAGDPMLTVDGYPLWNSPCINSGNPEMNDPDGSRKDMGAFFYPSHFTGLCVNEFMAVNDAVIEDDWGRTSDWIELYNGTSYDLDAGVLVFFGSDSAAADPWSPPRGTMIPARGFMLFWADGADWKGGNHMPFRLSGDGGSFSLSRTVAGSGALSTLEDIAFDAQTPDISTGRYPDGGEWRVLETPTPGYSNGSFYSTPVRLGWPSPNPCSTGAILLETTVAGGFAQIFIYDVAGRHVGTVFDGYCEPGTRQFQWSTAKLPSGVYLVHARCSGQPPASAKFTVLR
ncbi:hypothetical protein CSA37_01665 [Candidatus Fermentibacteria bacterium]|nr:MAG: hypothetical protein CSA37_01665 [Candidatus Fermentibacteria bacterium]